MEVEVHTLPSAQHHPHLSQCPGLMPHSPTHCYATAGVSKMWPGGQMWHKVLAIMQHEHWPEILVCGEKWDHKAPKLQP